MNKIDYKGFTKLQLNNNDLAYFYQNIDKPINEILTYNFYNNAYLLLIDDADNIIDKYKIVNNYAQKVQYNILESQALGTCKPKDAYQEIAIDSLSTNQLTVLRGPAGSGKSYLALSYLFQALEKELISKIIIFCNTVATAGAAKLGYYPGSREEKLLDSQIGNFLSSKIGGISGVERLITSDRLLLLPMSDVRGFDTSGMHAGVYIQECQNMTIDLLKLALQRIGDDSICILDGDNTAQVDLKIYEGENNGMRRVSEVFRGDYCYGEVELQKVYRSHIAELAMNM